VQLAQAIPAATAAPFSVDRPRSASVSVVSYAQGRSEALSRQAVCKVLGHQSGLLAFDCDVTFGASGAPVFDTSNGRARIVSLVSQGARTEEQSLAFGMELPGVVDDLKLALRTGAGVFPKTEITARRLSIGNPAAADLGAKFVRP
jgi:protease YdgD